VALYFDGSPCGHHTGVNLYRRYDIETTGSRGGGREHAEEGAIPKAVVSVLSQTFLTPPNPAKTTKDSFYGQKKIETPWTGVEQL
jgi:hypothetical protein